MEKSNLKNIVVLKDLPSNLVDEAILILKPNKDARKLEYICKSANLEEKSTYKNDDYVVKEAESVVASYISKVEKNKNLPKEKNQIDRKYNRLKIYSIIVSVVSVIIWFKSIF